MSESASATSNVGTGASAAGGAAGAAGSGALSAGSTATNAYGAMADAAMNTGSNAAEVGPTVGNAMSNYGSVAQNPSWFDNTMDFLSRYQKGSESNMLDAWKNKGFNAETAGYIGNKVKGMFTGGGSQPASPITINSSYQQPEDPYLMRRYMMKAGRR